MVLPNATILATQLMQAAEDRAGHQGLQFRPAAESKLRTMAENAAARILAEAKKKPPNRAEQYVSGAVRVGSEAMATFVDQMAIARLQITDYAQTNKNEVGEQTWELAHAVLCPIWPIC